MHSFFGEKIPMDDILINFKNMKWDNPAPGVRCKEHIKGNKKIRLVEFSDTFLKGIGVRKSM